MNRRIILLILMLVLLVIAAKAQEGRVVVVNFHYKDGFITIKGRTVKLGYYPDRKFQPEKGHRVEVVSVDNRKLYSFRFKLPLKVFTDYAAGSELKGGIIRLTETDFSLVLPYFEDAKEINFYNERNYKVATVNVSEEQFAPKKGLVFSYVIVLIIIGGVYVMMKKNIIKKKKR